MSALQQNTEEWLEFRKSKIGSSDAPIIMGKSPWKTPYDLWEEKLGMRESFWESKAMRRGKDLEPVALKSFQEKTGCVMWPDVKTHPEHHFIIASLDGITMNGKAAVEIKCPGEKTHQMALDGEIPEHYQIQMQHQLAVTDLAKMYYFSFDGEDGVILELQRDEEFIKEMIGKEAAFYTCMKDLVPPVQTREDPLWCASAEQWRAIQRKKMVLEQEEKICKQTLIQLAGNSDARGCGLRLTKYLRKGAVQYNKIPELTGVDLDAYRKESRELWRLTETEEN